MGVGWLVSVLSDTTVPDLWAVQDRDGPVVRRCVQRRVALAMGRLHRLDHHRLLYRSRR